MVPSLLFHLKKPVSNSIKRTQQSENLTWPPLPWPGSQGPTCLCCSLVLHNYVQWDPVG